MKLTKETVEHVATLSALRLEGQEAEQIQSELQKVLDLVEQLQEVNTDNVEPLRHVHGVVNAFRDDTASNSLTTSDLAEIAPQYTNAGIRVPKVV